MKDFDKGNFAKVAVQKKSGKNSLDGWPYGSHFIRKMNRHTSLLLQWFAHLGIRMVMNQFKATVQHSSHCNHRLGVLESFS